jgi:hypothetical protein
MTDHHERFLTLVDEIERTLPVTRWQVGEVPVWPLARIELYRALYWQDNDRSALDAQAAQQRRASARILRVVSHAATPLTNIWSGRKNLRDMALFARRADALFFGDEVSLDLVDGIWRDRLFDPVMAELHRQGRSTFLMQRGKTLRLPRAAPVLAANTIENWGPLFATGFQLSRRLAGAFPDYESVEKILHRHGAPTYAISPVLLRKRAAEVVTTADGFERVLRIVKPSICFMVTLATGHALALACRRRGVLSVEVQRAGLGSRYEGYNWSAVPEDGYSVLPAMFWTWTDDDAAAIESWSTKLEHPWHRSISGGHPQLSAWMDDHDPQTQAFDARIKELCAIHPAGLEILVALQGYDRYVDLLNDLAALIERAPSHWRWWLRRHPYVPESNRGLGRLMTIRRPNVLIDEAFALPLPALLRHVDAFVSVRSGASVEASMFGLKPIFLSAVARDLFPPLFARGQAEIIGDMTALEDRLGNLHRTAKTRVRQPDLGIILEQLDSCAAEYASLCARERSGQI